MKSQEDSRSPPLHMFLALTLFSNVVNFLDVCHSMDPEQNLLLPNTTCNCLELHKCDWLAVTTIKIDSFSIGQRENYIWKHQLRFYSVARDGTRISAAPRHILAAAFFAAFGAMVAGQCKFDALGCETWSKFWRIYRIWYALNEIYQYLD